MPGLTRAEIDAFLSQPLIARVATVRPDGRPHVVPVWYLWDGESIYIETPPTFIKARNLMENPNIAITIDISDGGLRFKAVILEGKAELLTEREYAVDMCRCIYIRYLGSEGVESPTPQRMIHDNNLIIKLTPSRILTWDSTRDGLAPIGPM